MEFDGKTYCFDKIDLVGRIELLIGLSVSRRVDIPLFSAILIDGQMSWEDLYRQYTGKNVLNMFRQDKGYQTGSYQKNWGGREDNEHLVEIISALDVKAEGFRGEIYIQLNERYMATNTQAI